MCVARHDCTQQIAISCRCRTDNGRFRAGSPENSPKQPLLPCSFTRMGLPAHEASTVQPGHVQPRSQQPSSRVEANGGAPTRQGWGPDPPFPPPPPWPAMPPQLQRPSQAGRTSSPSRWHADPVTPRGALRGQRRAARPTGATGRRLRVSSSRVSHPCRKEALGPEGPFLLQSASAFLLPLSANRFCTQPAQVRKRASSVCVAFGNVV